MNALSDIAYDLLDKVSNLQPFYTTNRCKLILGAGSRSGLHPPKSYPGSMPSTLARDRPRLPREEPCCQNEIY
jgi:hypothetical protein